MAHRWTKAEDEYILKNYLRLTHKEIADNCRVSVATLSRHIFNLNIRRQSREFASSESERVISSTLCWECQNAAGGSPCCWINGHKPVPGWNAIPTTITSSIKEKPIQSYKVIECPLFISD